MTVRITVSVLVRRQLRQHVHGCNIQEGASREQHCDSGGIHRIKCFLLFLANAEVCENRQQWGRYGKYCQMLSNPLPVNTITKLLKMPTKNN